MEDRSRPFLEHLEELRVRLIRAVVGVAAGTAVGYQFVDRVIADLSKPVGRFIFLHPTEAFFVRLKIALGLGVLLSAPVIMYQLWKFVMVALTPEERRSIFWVLPSSYLLFLAGASFGFFFLVPAGVKFLLSYSSAVLVPNLAIDQYVDFVGTMCLVLGGIFQMPLVSYFVSRFGLMDSSWLAEKRRIALVVIYIASALLTPGPDPVTAIMLFVPSYLLYEASIVTARWGSRA